MCETGVTGKMDAAELVEHDTEELVPKRGAWSVVWRDLVSKNPTSTKQPFYASAVGLKARLGISTSRKCIVHLIMHEKKKTNKKKPYKPGNRHNLEKKRDIIFWSNRPALV